MKPNNDTELAAMLRIPSPNSIPRWLSGQDCQRADVFMDRMQTYKAHSQHLAALRVKEGAKKSKIMKPQMWADAVRIRDWFLKFTIVEGVCFFVGCDKTKCVDSHRGMCDSCYFKLRYTALNSGGAVGGGAAQDEKVGGGK